MKFTRREFIRDGVAVFTVGFAAPAFLSDLARAQGASGRTLVVLYLSGGNDALSTLIRYQDRSITAAGLHRPCPPPTSFRSASIGREWSSVSIRGLAA